MRWVRHRATENKRLFPYNDLSTYSDCDELIICLSERSLNIILNALTKTEEMRTRVWKTRQGDLYELCSDEEFEEFRQWTSNLYNELGSWAVCNEQLTRIAEAIEAIQANTQVMADNTETLVTWQEMLDDLETALGIGNVFYLLMKTFSDMFPSFKNIKMNPWPLISTIYRSRTYEVPLLVANQAQALAQQGMLSAMGASKILEQVKAIVEGFGTLNTYYDNIRNALFGDWSVLGGLISLIDWFIPDEDGGTGGEDPDNDPGNRTAVNVATNISQTINVDCTNCGGSGHNSSCCPSMGGDTPITSVPDIPSVEEPDREGPPPTGYDDWGDYDDDKCKRIRAYLEDFIGTLENFGGLFGMVGGLTVAVIVGLLLLTVPPVGLSILMAALGTLVAIDIGLLVHFTSVATYLRDNIDEIVCDMEDDETTEDMYLTLTSHLSSAITSLSLLDPTIEGTLETATASLISNENLSFIITSNTVPTEWATYECPCVPTGACVEPYSGTLTFEYGNETSLGDGEYTIIPEITTGWNCGDGYSIQIVSNLEDPFEICEIEVIEGSLSGALGTLCGENDVYIVASESTTGPCDTPNAFADDVAPLVGNSYHYLTIVSCSPYELRIKLSNVAP